MAPPNMEKKRKMRRRKRNKSEHKQVEEQLLYQANLLQNVSDAIITSDLDFNITSWNQAAEALYGWRASEVIGQPTSQILQTRYATAQPEQVKQQFLEQGIWKGEAIQNHKSGATVDVLASVSLIRDNAGNPVGVVTVNRDITERKQAEEALRLSEERFAKAFRASPDSIVITRMSDGRMIEVNDQWVRLFGYSREEAIGRTSLELHLFANPADRRLFLSQLETQGFIRDLELALCCKSGEVRQMSISGELLVIAGERCILSLTRDITERKQAEAKLEETMVELTRSNAELQQFAYVASHDLQEPLRMVASYTQLLARRYQGKLDADADEFIAFAVDGATRMQQLLKGLLAYSRVNTQGQPLQLTNSEVVLEQALANLQLMIVENQAIVTHDPMPAVLVDKTQLLQLFQNLISNALKFRAEEPPQVHISARQQGQEWLFSVRDNGIGLESQDVDRIFVIFKRLHTRQEYPGNGVGLAICKRIVERHGGRIWVESQPGQGAIFYFTLPAG